MVLDMNISLEGIDEDFLEELEELIKDKSCVALRITNVDELDL